jgi:hypothetical protein
MFTDNYVTECAYFKGTSSSPILFVLVLRLRKLELHSGWKIYGIHITGTRMISQGTDGLSQGDMLTGVMGGSAMLTFIHLALTAIERQSELMEWVDSRWGMGNNSWLTPEGWYAGSGRIGTYVWCPPPDAADADLYQLCKCHLKQPGVVTSLFVVPRLLTSRWRKRGSRVGKFSFTIPSATAVWKRDITNHICALSVSLSLATDLGSFGVPNSWEIWRGACAGCNRSILPGRESFAEISRAGEGPVIHAEWYGAAPVTCRRSRTCIL